MLRPVLFLVTLLVAVLPTLALASYSDLILADGPIAYLRLDEASGSIANDSSPSADPLEMFGGRSGPVAGPIGTTGGGLLLDGSTGFVRDETFGRVDQSSMTVSMWFQPLSSGGRRYLASASTPTGDPNGCCVR
jgi:hypothetical protein